MCIALEWSKLRHKVCNNSYVFICSVETKSHRQTLTKKYMVQKKVKAHRKKLNKKTKLNKGNLKGKSKFTYYSIPVGTTLHYSVSLSLPNQFGVYLIFNM